MRASRLATLPTQSLLYVRPAMQSRSFSHWQSSSLVLVLQVYYRLKASDASLKTRYASNPVMRALASALFSAPIWLLSSHLNHIMMVTLETAVELWISLTDSQQVREPFD